MNNKTDISLITDETSVQHRRIVILDELRGVALIAMVVFHAFYLWHYVFGFSWATEPYFKVLLPIQPFIAITFILLSGISCLFAKSNLKRGLKLVIIALILTAATVLVLPLMGLDGLDIIFGILHLLGCCMLLAAFVLPRIERVNPYVACAVCLVLYLLTFNVENGFIGFNSFSLQLPEMLYSTDALFVFGFHTPDFFSSDYFPLLPNVFLFFAGSFVGLAIKKAKLPGFAYSPGFKPLAFIGRHTLVVYLAHQPLLYAVTWLVSFIVSHA